MKPIALLIAILALSGCSSIAKNAIKNNSASEVELSAGQCITLKRQCDAADYQQWQQRDGSIGCSCDKIRY
ncbi:hypothetical protein [uncultured Ferrimonas sp.]|uniref:hypothetical protein n=1 Tax=uncultured Ferrimonas sp. TaxID=432640 RepID=UPI0026220984|nr:hypothetical protein [uncultured Ferrimonas sp.]